MISGALYHLVATSSISNRTYLVFMWTLTFSHEPRLTLLSLYRSRLKSSCQTEIANLELTIGVNEQVARLEITVQHVSTVDVLETAEDLVNEGLEVRICQGLTGADDSSKIALHKL